MKTFQQFLNEMAAKIQSIGDFSNPVNMYHKGDDKIITKGAIKAEKLWEKSRGNFKLIFLNDPSYQMQMMSIGGGKVKLNPLDAVVDTSNVDPKRLEEMQNMIPKMNAGMNSKFGELLDSFHGKVFMM